MFTVTSYIPEKESSPQNHSDVFNVEYYSTVCEARNVINTFIENGFKQTYQANIKVTTPFVLALIDGSLKAALGIRYGSSPLFIEQYLPENIEIILKNSGLSAQRKDVVEIAHLYSNAQKFTIPLFLTTVISLFYLHKKYLVFTGTSHVLDIVKRTGVNIHHLSEADPSQLSSSKDWGTYYDTSPYVVAVSLQDVMSIVEKSPRFQSLVDRLLPKIANVIYKMQVLV